MQHTEEKTIKGWGRKKPSERLSVLHKDSFTSESKSNNSRFLFVSRTHKHLRKRITPAHNIHQHFFKHWNRHALVILCHYSPCAKCTMALANTLKTKKLWREIYPWCVLEELGVNLDLWVLFSSHSNLMEHSHPALFPASIHIQAKWQMTSFKSPTFKF